MASLPPPQGMNEADYDAIEAAVTETVRGRWFLNEFARRNRLAETHQLLDAMGRLEAAVSGNQAALPSTDPSIRLMIQRIKEIAGQLGGVASDMRNAGIDTRYVEAVDSQARAVAGMMRSASIGKAERSGNEISPALQTTSEPGRSLPPMTRQLRHSDRRKALEEASAHAQSAISLESTDDPRLAALSRLDRMSLAEKLAFFT